jgi:hypothetical protein
LEAVVAVQHGMRKKTSVLPIANNSLLSSNSEVTKFDRNTFLKEFFNQDYQSTKPTRCSHENARDSMCGCTCLDSLGSVTTNRNSPVF